MIVVLLRWLPWNENKGVQALQSDIETSVNFALDTSLSHVPSNDLIWSRRHFGMKYRYQLNQFLSLFKLLVDHICHQFARGFSYVPSPRLPSSTSFILDWVVPCELENLVFSFLEGTEK
jgi:hypothetical protein